MERTQEILEARVRNTPLEERLKDCQKRIGNMCAELRGPKMSIPVEHYDDDFYINTTLADAQAAIAALQARVQELEAIKIPDDAFTYCAYCGEKSPVDEHNEDLAAHIKVCPKHPMRDVETQLTQRTAELEAAKAESNAYYRKAIEFEHELYGDPGHGLGLVHVEKELKKGREALKASLQLAHGRVKFLEDKNTAVQAELKRVSLLSSHNERRFEMLEEKYKELRTLILTLPKVEGEIVAQAGYVKDRKKVYACFGSDADMTAYAALLTHRQGMEG